jgi:hypothetical protein
MADILKAYAVALASLLAGAAFVHSIYKPDLVRTQFYTLRDCQTTAASPINDTA